MKWMTNRVWDEMIHTCHWFNAALRYYLPQYFPLCLAIGWTINTVLREMVTSVTGVWGCTEREGNDEVFLIGDKLRLQKNGRHSADDTFQNYFLIQTLLKFLLKGSTDNKSTSDQVLVWHKIGDKPLREVMMTKFYEPICAYSGNTWLCVHWQWNTREWCH